MNKVPSYPTLEGKEMPRLALGTWQAEPPERVEEVVYHAIKNGYRHIDCAAVYGNEVYVGNAVRKAIQDKIVTRQDLWITSKLWNTNHAKDHVLEACSRTLRDLGLDYLDLYLIHFPIALKYVPPQEMYPPVFFNNPAEPDLLEIENVPISETWEAMENLVHMNLVKHIGVSNFDLQILQDLLRYCNIKPLTNQIELHPYLQQKRMIKFCAAFQIAVSAYSPFGGKPYITLKMAQEDELHVLDHPVINKIAAKYEKTPAQVVLRWALSLGDNVVVLTKTASPQRATENINIFDFDLSKEDMEILSKLDCNRRYNDFAVVCENKRPYYPIFS